MSDILVMIILANLGNDRDPWVSLMLYSKKPTSYSHESWLKNSGGRIVFMHILTIFNVNAISFGSVFTLDKHFLTISI